MEELLEVQVNAVLHNEELTGEELREMAIFLTHYVGFPLGSKLDGAVKRVVGQAQEGRGEGRRERQEGQRQRRRPDARRQGPSMTSRYASAVTREELADAGSGAAADRSADRPVRNGHGASSEFGRRTRCCRSPSRSGPGASPIYTERMQKALKYEGVDVITIFKGLQLDIGAPPQFMDFRYAVHDRWHGEFHLDHCGALLDVEPMGEDYVRGMCHDIEDPTFDATAVATNPKAQVRPIHRPPRTPTDQHPHCRVDRDHRRVLPRGRATIPVLDVVRQTTGRQNGTRPDRP